MSAYRTVVVGTDGSESSLRAVEKAAALAGDADATLVIACAYYPADPKDTSAAADALRVRRRRGTYSEIGGRTWFDRSLILAKRAR